MIVAVFGGSAPQPGDTAYGDAKHLGGLLARQGYITMTGGYMGVMEAVSRGANEAGGHVIGITCAEIELWRQSKANPWVTEERSFPTLKARLYALIDTCDAAIVMPGGVGTMAELSVMWNELIINNKQSKPLILVGLEWQKVLNQFLDSFGGYINQNDRVLIQVAADVESAVGFLQSIS